MSKLKKLGSMLLALVFAIGMTCTAMADESYTITINNSTSGYTYVAYQIFAGELSEETDGSLVLSNITWGSDIDSTNEALLAALAEAYGTTDAAAIAERLAETNTAAAADAFASIIADYVSGGTTFTYSEENSNYTATVSAAGYYLIVNTGVPSGNYTYSDYIMEVVSDVTADTKDAETPGFDKTVGTSDDGDLDDTDDATEDYAIGDSVPFTLTATLPSDYADYDTYKLVFNDTLSSGLTYDANSLTVKAGETTLVAGTDYTLVVDGQNITVTITDLTAIEELSLSAGDTIVVSYTATLNENAGSIENNDASLTYSNNPNDDGTGTTGTTPDDKTYVVTFTVNVNKVDGENNPLTGAEFTLYKLVDGEYEETGTVLTVGSDGTSFSINGLAVGTYKLVETATPTGYNTADDIVFTITAEAIEDATEDDGVTVTITSPTVSDGFTISAESLTTTVVNNKGSNLPSTGGMGTTIFYVVGGVLVAGAVVLLITKKRMAE